MREQSNFKTGGAEPLALLAGQKGPHAVAPVDKYSESVSRYPPGDDMGPSAKPAREARREGRGDTTAPRLPAEIGARRTHTIYLRK